MSGADPWTGLVKIHASTDGGRRKHAQRAGDDGGFIRKDVSEEIFRKNNIEVARHVHQVHGAGIHVLMFESYAGILAGDLRHRRAPKLRHFENVCLVYRGDFLAPFGGQLKSDVCYPDYFIPACSAWCSRLRLLRDSTRAAGPK